MADALDTMPLGMTEEELRRYLAMFAPSAEDRAASRNLGLMQFGLGLLGAQKGQEFSAAGRAGLLGINAYQTDLQNRTRERGQNLTQAIALRNAAAQTGLLGKMQNILGGGGMTQTMPGPDAQFQQPGGAEALMNSGAGGSAPPMQALPTRVPDMAAQGNTRQQLANLNTMGVAAGLKDLSPALKFQYPDPIALRAGADAIDPSTNSIMPGAPPIPGYYFDRKSRSYVKIPGAAEAEASSQAIPRAVGLAFEPPQPRIDASGQQAVPSGNRLSQIFGGAPLPYNAPAQYPAQPAAQSQQGPILDPNFTQQERAIAMADWQKNYGPNAAPSGGGNVTALAPTKAAEFTKRGDQLAEVEQGIQGAATNAIQNQARIGEMRKVVPLIPFGALAPTKLDIAKYALEVPGVGNNIANAVIPNAKNAVPAMQVFNKSATNMVIEQSKQLGTREAAQVIQMVANANPNIGWTRPAAETIMDYLDGSNKWAMERAQALPAWKKSHGGSSEGFQEAWNAERPMADYIPPMDKIRQAVQTGTVSDKPEPAGNPQLQKVVDEMRKRGMVQ